MNKIIKLSSVILFLFVLPIGFFYSPNLSTYVLGSLREGVVSGWLFANFSFVIGLGILVFLIMKDLIKSRWSMAVFVFVLAGVVVLHGVPSMFYWDYISAGQTINDDTATAVANPSIWMFLWHLIIASLAIFIMITSVISRARAR